MVVRKYTHYVVYNMMVTMSVLIALSVAAWLFALQEFPLMFARILFVVFSLMFDRTASGELTPWKMLFLLICLTSAVLALVVVLKPYSGSASEGGTLSEGDRQMVLAQSLQLIGYATAALCLWSTARQQALGEPGLGGGVEVFATLVGVAIVLVQAAPVVLTFAGRGGAAGEGVVVETKNPMGGEYEME